MTYTPFELDHDVCCVERFHYAEQLCLEGLSKKQSETSNSQRKSERVLATKKGSSKNQKKTALKIDKRAAPRYRMASCPVVKRTFSGYK